MPRKQFAMCLVMLATGCTEPVPPPATPPPLVLDATPETTDSTTKPAGATAVEETWTHTLPSNDGKDREVILKYVRDQDGVERFEFVQHPWSDKPVFTEQIKNGGESELRFKMVKAANESEATERSVRYVLNEENGKWVGKLFESWNEVPYDVTLTKGL